VKGFLVLSGGLTLLVPVATCSAGCNDPCHEPLEGPAWRFLRVGAPTQDPCPLPLGPAFNGDSGTCGPEADDDICTGCVKASCCIEVLRCFSDTDCACFTDCRTSGASLATCTERCGESQHVYEAGTACFTAHCAPECTELP
jgi:hypothetical protein